MARARPQLQDLGYSSMHVSPSCYIGQGPPPVQPRFELRTGFVDTVHPNRAPNGGFVRRSSRLECEMNAKIIEKQAREMEMREDSDEEDGSGRRGDADPNPKFYQQHTDMDYEKVIHHHKQQGKSAQTSPSGNGIPSPQQRPRTVPPIAPQAADSFAIPMVPNDPPTDTRKNRLSDLPTEVQEHVMDYLAGPLGSASSGNASRNWNHAMRHPRRKQLTRLALVCPLWRAMVQERVFRHIKIQGTHQGIRNTCIWFNRHPHLRQYVKHVECWVPVWEWSRPPAADAHAAHILSRNDSFDSSNTIPGAWPGVGAIARTNIASSSKAGPRQHSQKASLYDIFHCIQQYFPDAFAITVEGGSCKNSMAILHQPCQDRRPPLIKLEPLPILPKVTTLILKGAYNVMRNNRHYMNLVQALPSLREWYFAYAKPKRDAYKNLCNSLQRFPSSITHLNLCFDGLNVNNKTTTAQIMAIDPPHKSARDKCLELLPDYHLCQALGHVLPQLEHLTYSGPICNDLFKAGARAALTAQGSTKRPCLKSIDIVLRCCCSMPKVGVPHYAAFIEAFESFVISCLRSLTIFRKCRDIRIRYIDFDCPLPTPNPYFQIKNGKDVTGLWSDEILQTLAKVRPDASYDSLEELPEGCASVHNTLGSMGMIAGMRLKSMSAESFHARLRGMVEGI